MKALKLKIKNQKSKILCLALLLAGCDALSSRNDESKDLANVTYTVRAMYDGHERTVTITPAGEIAIFEQLQDKPPRRIVSEITNSERADLVAAFQGWKKLNDSYAVDVSPQIVINYGGKMVTTSRPDTVPEPFGRAKTVLDKIAIDISMAADAKVAADTKAAEAKAATEPAASQPVQQ